MFVFKQLYDNGPIQIFLSAYLDACIDKSSFKIQKWFLFCQNVHVIPEKL